MTHDPASPPCFAHLTGEGADPAERKRALIRWRKAERERLIALRLVLPAEERAEIAKGVARALDRRLSLGAEAVVSLYWPFRGELDLRFWLAEIAARGVATALPVVVVKGAPLVFRRWAPGEPMTRGVWNIPIPETGEEVTPTVVIAPLVGFDRRLYRLGYGGGFFDRTLAGFAEKPLTIGVGVPTAEIDSVYPQDWDVPMDLIVTGESEALDRT